MEGIGEMIRTTKKAFENESVNWFARFDRRGTTLRVNEIYGSMVSTQEKQSHH